eukprot:TRINITY_DN5027_c0_g1_i2.p1 TRINITY_DN5027_c0_g1~~TRINITY_DN5027_c0_g1_i2.p1  ORF type:complete len:677 (-),score=171.29 TRINITY_DN5027_c0_g1_i2:49-1926(-)
MTLDSKTFKTRSVSVSAPFWDEHFEFPLRSTSQFLEVSLFEPDLIGSHTFFGRVIVPMESVLEGEPFEEVTYRLLPRDLKQKVSGTIKLRIGFSAFQADERFAHSEDGLSSLSVGAAIRGKVSKQKRRFLDDGFNLDLSYITDRIIAMGFPADALEGIYRNNINDVKRFFEKRHPNCYKIYNLCTERTYDAAHFHGRVETNFAFPDHFPCPFQFILPFCQDVRAWFEAHPQNVAAIHCKAGKGRTGLLIACYLMFSEQVHDAETALQVFAEERTLNGEGVTIPSQIRYVNYFHQYLRSIRSPAPFITDERTLFLRHLSFTGLSAFSHSSLYFVISNGEFRFNSHKTVNATKNLLNKSIDFDCGPYLPVSGDVMVEVFSSSLFGKDRLFHFFFNTRFVPLNLVLDKSQLDKAAKDNKHAKFPPDLAATIGFGEPEESRPARAAFALEQIQSRYRSFSSNPPPSPASSTTSSSSGFSTPTAASSSSSSSSSANTSPSSVASAGAAFGVTLRPATPGSMRGIPASPTFFPRFAAQASYAINSKDDDDEPDEVEEQPDADWRVGQLHGMNIDMYGAAALASRLSSRHRIQVSPQDVHLTLHRATIPETVLRRKPSITIGHSFRSLTRSC